MLDAAAKQDGIELAAQTRPFSVLEHRDESSSNRVTESRGGLFSGCEGRKLTMEGGARSGVVFEEDRRPKRPGRAEERGKRCPHLLGPERLVLEQCKLPAVERLGEVGVAVREHQASMELDGQRAAKLVESGRLPGRGGRGDRQHRSDPERPAVESLEEHWAGRERCGRCQADCAHDVGELARRVRRVVGRPERAPELDDAVPVGLAPEVPREEAFCLGPMAGELAFGRGPDAESRPELALDPDAQTDERCGCAVGSAFAEQGALELRVAPAERLVVPVEAAARLGDANEEIKKHRPEEGVVRVASRAGVRACVDRCGRLATELVERDLRIAPPSEDGRTLLDEVANERPVLVQ